MSYVVNFKEISAEGLDGADAEIREKLAGLRANEARYFATHYKQDFVVFPADEKPELAEILAKVLADRDIKISAELLEVADLTVENEQQFSGRARWIYGFFANGLTVNILYSLDSSRKRAVGFKLSDGMAQPAELGTFKFVRQKSKLAGEIRGSFFVIKKEYPEIEK